MQFQKRRIWCQTILLAIILLLTIPGGVGLWLWRSELDYWQQWQAVLRRTSPQDLKRIAESLEKRTLARLSPVPPSATYTGGTNQTRAPNGDKPTNARDPDTEGDIRQLSIKLVELNAWLDTKLSDWLAYQERSLPNQVGSLMIATEKEQLVLAFRFTTPEIRSIVSLFFEIRTLGDQHQPQLEIRLVRVKAGKLPVPFKSLVKHLHKHETHQAKLELIEALDIAFAGRMFDPVVALPGDDQRLARLLSLQLSGDTVHLMIRIEPLSEH